MSTWKEPILYFALQLRLTSSCIESPVEDCSLTMEKGGKGGSPIESVSLSSQRESTTPSPELSARVLCTQCMGHSTLPPSILPGHNYVKRAISDLLSLMAYSPINLLQL